jgi:hypothetical protein
MPNVTKDARISDATRSAYGTQNRRGDYPEGHFLLVEGGNRKFPYKDPQTGAIDCALLRGAITRAAQYNYPEVEKKAQALYKTHCADKDKDFNFKVLKDEMQGIVLGVVASPDEPPDEAGHVLDKEAIEEMCWEYNKNFAVLKYRHTMGLTKDEAVILESYIAPVAFELNGIKIKEGTWLQRVQLISQELKDQVKSGLIKGLSLGGYIIDSEPID